MRFGSPLCDATSGRGKYTKGCAKAGTLCVGPCKSDIRLAHISGHGSSEKYTDQCRISIMGISWVMPFCEDAKQRLTCRQPSIGVMRCCTTPALHRQVRRIITSGLKYKSRRWIYHWVRRRRGIPLRGITSRGPEATIGRGGMLTGTAGWAARHGRGDNRTLRCLKTRRHRTF
jgi:hypothetical protein